MAQKTIPAGAFKAKCLSIMDEVKAKRETIVITKHGEPVAKLVPMNDDRGDDIFGFFKGKGSIKGDVVTPFSPEEWGSLY
jgi:prevent-host-death family protein